MSANLLPFNFTRKRKVQATPPFVPSEETPRAQVTSRIVEDDEATPQPPMSDESTPRAPKPPAVTQSPAPQQPEWAASVLPLLDSSKLADGVSGKDATPPILSDPATATRPRFKTPPKVVYGEDGRPERSIHSPDSVEREKTYQGAVQTAKPDTPSWKERLIPALLEGFARGGIGGALFGGARGLLDKKGATERWRQRETAQSRAHLGELYGQQKVEDEHLDAVSGRKLKDAQIADLEQKPQRTAEAAAEKAKASRARSIISMLKKLPEFDPTAPENVDTVAQMKDAGVPVVGWKANQQINFELDPRNGEWRVFAANKQTGEATSGTVTDRATGAPTVTSTKSQMQAEIAEKNRQFRKEESEANRRQRQEQFAGRMKLGWANYQQRIAEAGERARQAAERDRLNGIRTAVSLAKAKAQAEQKGFDLPDYVDMLTDAGIEVVK